MNIASFMRPHYIMWMFKLGSLSPRSPCEHIKALWLFMISLIYMCDVLAWRCNSFILKRYTIWIFWLSLTKISQMVLRKYLILSHSPAITPMDQQLSWPVFLIPRICFISYIDCPLIGCLFRFHLINNSMSLAKVFEHFLTADLWYRQPLVFGTIYI